MAFRIKPPIKAKIIVRTNSLIDSDSCFWLLFKFRFTLKNALESSFFNNSTGYNVFKYKVINNTVFPENFDANRLISLDNSIELNEVEYNKKIGKLKIEFKFFFISKSKRIKIRNI